ncbi:MAG TPA: SRPBCC family protein [Pseudomonadales bacterium]|jgi:ribosome-associated toxin RatA of RatAB toxin-antitoxin module
MPRVERSIEIAAPVSRVQQVIVDFERYPEFVPFMERAELLGIEGERRRVRFTLNLVARISYTLDLVPGTDSGLTWTLVDGPFVRNNGSWRLKATNDDGTLATYTADVELKGFLPGFLERRLVAESLPATLRAFRDRAESDA